MPTLITKDNLAANTITAEKIASTVALGGPKITSIVYPGDDTAALPAGGQSITVNGAGFITGAVIHVDGTVVSPVTFNSANSLTFTAPAKAANSYILYVINPDGGTAIAIPGLTYSGIPAWTTSAGSLGAPYEANSFSVTLQATSDSNVTFSVSAGNTIPAGLTLASNGLLSGTIPATEANTTYTFYVDAIDAQNQETSRTFSITYTRDTVTWSSPADSASFTWQQGSANTIALSATSAAGKSVSFAVQSGSLPANVTVSGSNISGTPTTVQANTSVVLRATAATTSRFADRTIYFIVPSAGPSVIGEAYGGGYYAGQISTSLNGVATHYLIVSPAATGDVGGRQWKTDNSSTSGTSSLYDGPSNSSAMNDSSHPAAQFCENLNIGGYTDWYLPSLYELAICYYNLKPGTALNLTSIGTNPAAVPARNSNYSEGTPSQTAAVNFQAGGNQAFGQTEYWTSSQFSSNDAWWINFTNGNQVAAYGKTNTMRVRAIRRVAY
jgi:hypothetical protein